MSGGLVPYRLRQNKAVDRYAFIEVVRMLGQFLPTPVRDYAYVGFGGPSLEDFKLVHSQFDITHMISVEVDEQVHKRQKFNQPISCIRCLCQSSGDFLNSFQRDRPSIVWLDYTKASEIGDQLNECEGLIRKLQEFDVLKITLNAHPANWGSEATGKRGFDLWDLRYQKLKEALGNSLVPTVTPDMMVPKQFPTALLRSLKRVVERALQSRLDITFLPLTSFAYADGQQMVSLTGILISRSKEDDLLERTGLKHWPLLSNGWVQPKKINVPSFTLKEKLYVDSRLPRYRAETIHKWLGLRFSDDEDTSLEMLKVYSEIYRFFPYYSKVSV